MSVAGVIGADGRTKDRQGVPGMGVVFRAKWNAVQVCANNVWVDGKPQQRQIDPWGWYDPATGRFTPKVPGYYRLAASTMQSPGNSGTWCYLRLSKNSAQHARSAQMIGQGMLDTTSLFYLDGKNDYVVVQVQSDNYSAANGVYGDNGVEDYSWFEGELVGVSVGVVPEPWHYIGAAGEPPFQNGWVNYDAVNQDLAAFYKDPGGVVRLKGLVKTGPLNQTAFVLPVGYRPNRDARFITIQNGAFGVTNVLSNGNVVHLNSNVYVDMITVSFRAEG